MNIDKFESNVEYTTKLSNFEGPLDLLLYLVKQAEIEIKDIFVSEVTNQFLEYVNNSNIDSETEGEYLIIAATIIEIKSKAIIPNEQEDLGDEDDPKANLINLLEEYKLYKESAEKLKEKENVNKFYKEPDKGVGDFRIVYTDFNLEGLVKAYLNVLAKADTIEEIESEKEIPKEVFTVKDKIYYIMDLLDKRDCVSFFELFRAHATKSEIITTFQALLELVKLQNVKFKQEENFEDITIIKSAKEDLEIGELEEYN